MAAVCPGRAPVSDTISRLQHSSGTSGCEGLANATLDLSTGLTVRLSLGRVSRTRPSRPECGDTDGQCTANARPSGLPPKRVKGTRCSTLGMQRHLKRSFEVPLQTRAVSVTRSATHRHLNDLPQIRRRYRVPVQHCACPHRHRTRPDALSHGIIPSAALKPWAMTRMMIKSKVAAGHVSD